MLELLVTLVLITLITLWAVPNFRPIIQANQLANHTNQLLHALYAARSTAIAQQATTVMCATSDYATCHSDWNISIMTFIDANNNQRKEANEGSLSVIEGTQNTHVSRLGPTSPIVFSATGLTATPASFNLCVPNSSLARRITVSLQGRVRTSNSSTRCN